MNQVGRDIPRLEVRAKVTGRAEYTHNLRLPGMLYGKVFRATVPHGRIRSIDTQAARELPGVHRVITGEDIRKLIPEPYYGPAFHDQPILALDKVRYVGEPVAAVLASDPHVAEQAVQLISAEYDELPAVYDEVAAMQPDTLVHDVLRPAGTFADLKHLQGRKGTNVALDYHLRRGDADKAFAAADRVIEHTFKTQQCLHLPFESHVAIAEPGDDRLTIYTSNQTPSFVRIEIARLFGWPENHVRVKVPYLGGGYRLQSLRQARSSRRGAGDARSPSGEDRADDGRAVLHDHQASDDVPHQKRRRQSRACGGAVLPGVLERRRLCRYRPAGDAEIRLYRRRAIRHRQCQHRFLRALHQPHAGRRACAALAFRNWSGPTRATPT